MAAQSDFNMYISCILNEPSWTVQDRQLAYTALGSHKGALTCCALRIADS